MGFWIFKSAREKALGGLRKEIGALRELAEGDFEDTEIMELSREVRLLRELIVPQGDEKKQQPQQPGNEFVRQLPGMARDIASEMFGPSFGGMAEKMVNGIVSDPARIKMLMDKLSPMLQKAGVQQQAQPQGTIPGIPVEYLQGYVPQQ